MDELITLRLTTEHVKGIIRTLNALPTSSNAWPLVQEILRQMDAQQDSTEEGA